jgi:hypothetical protein|tara:strand:+ start:146 stop:304 length:159 start_codon:yes stop_codon:yes gene_type:complete
MPVIMADRNVEQTRFIKTLNNLLADTVPQIIGGGRVDLQKMKVCSFGLTGLG